MLFLFSLNRLQNVVLDFFGWGLRAFKKAMLLEVSYVVEGEFADFALPLVKRYY